MKWALTGWLVGTALWAAVIAAGVGLLWLYVLANLSQVLAR